MTRQIRVGDVRIGGGAPVVIQSMLNTKTTDVEGSLVQLRQLYSAGCQVARLAVPNMEAARGFAEIAKESPLPLVADIHFDYKLAIAAAEGGASKIRINPGNIGGEDRVKAVVDVCKDKKIPSALASTADLWINGFWKSMAIPPRKRWWRVPLSIWSCWKRTAFMIPVYP